jgi:hypothetical protein
MSPAHLQLLTQKAGSVGRGLSVSPLHHLPSDRVYGFTFRRIDPRLSLLTNQLRQTPKSIASLIAYFGARR